MAEAHGRSQSVYMYKFLEAVCMKSLLWCRTGEIYLRSSRGVRHSGAAMEL